MPELLARALLNLRDYLVQRSAVERFARENTQTEGPTENPQQQRTAAQEKAPPAAD